MVFQEKPTKFQFLVKIQFITKKSVVKKINLFK